MAQIGVNAWVWSSPVNTAEFGRLAPMVKQMGFDLIEFGVEGTSDLDYAEAARIARGNGLAVSVCAAMGPDRDLIHSDESICRNGMDYVRHCIDAAKIVGAANVIGPLYSAVGRTWQSTDDERKRDTDLLVRQLKDLFHATSVHRLLQHLLGIPQPTYRHHPLVLDAAGQKLSKSTSATGLRELRGAGMTPANIRRLVGLP